MIKKLLLASAFLSAITPAFAAATIDPKNAIALTPDQILSAGQEELEGSVPLELVGLVVMANSLRPDSTYVIQQLQAAQIRCARLGGGPGTRPPTKTRCSGCSPSSPQTSCPHLKHPKRPN